MTSPGQTAPHGDEKPLHEPRDVRLRGPFWTGVVLLALLVALLGAVAWLYGHGLRAAGQGGGATYEFTHGPEYEAEILRVRRELDARHAAALSGQPLVPGEHGVVTMPVEDALRVIAERGLPDWSRPPGAAEDAAWVAMREAWLRREGVAP